MADIKVGFKADPSSLSNILSEIQKTVGNGLNDLKVSIKEIDLGNAANRFADSLNSALSKVDFSKSLKIDEALTGTNTALGDLTKQLTEVKTTIDQLNRSFNDIGSRGTAGLDSIIASMRELNSLVQQISSKDFNITNMLSYQAAGAGNSGIALYRDQARELLSVLEQLRSAMDQIDSKTMGKIYTDMKAQFAALDSMNMTDLNKRIGNKTVGGIQSMIDEAQRYKHAMEEIINASAQLGSSVVMPDTAGLDQATRKITEFEQRGKQVEQTFIEAAEATTRLSNTAASVDGAQQQIATSTGNASETLTAIKSLTDEIGVSFQSLKSIIDTTFDFTKAISGITELKNEIESLGASLDAMQSSLSRMRNASVTADERAMIAAQKKLLSSESSETKRSYDTMLRGGYAGAEVDQIKQKYSELVAAIEQVNAANRAASSEQISNLQAEGNAIRQSIAAIQEKAAAAQAAASAQSKASDRARRDAENESKAQERAAQRMAQAADQKQIANMRSRITTFINNNSKAYEMFQGRIDAMMAELSQGSDVSKARLAEIATEFTNIGIAARNAGALGQTFFQKLQSGWQRFGGWALVTRSFMLIINGFKQMINSVKNLDLAMTELKKVTDLTTVGYENFYQKAVDAATSVGASVSDTINATADFARLGYDVSEALSLAEASLVYKNVGDGIGDISQATESLISTLKAFRIEADDAMTIVDEFNEVGNNFAISSTGIGDALQRSASALYGAGNTLEESIGLITAANAIVQNPEAVGTAMKTLTMYLRAAKTELEDAGESSEGCAESVSKLREQLMDLTGVDIMLDKDTFKSTYQIIKEISEVWENLTDTTRANVTSLIAGKRNANVVQALMTNFEDAENAMQTAANATGSAFAENEKYIDSIAGRLDILKGQFEAFSQGLINDGIVKFFVTLATKILELGNALNKVHLLMPLIAASIAGIAGSGLVGDVSKIITSVQTIINLNGNAASVSTTLTGAIAGLSKQQKVLLANQLQTIMASETVDAEYKKQIASVLGLISADTGLAAANQGVAASFAAIWTAIPLAGKIALIAVALTSVIQIISGFTKSAEDMKEEANGIVDSFSNAQKEYSNNSKTLSELSDRYNELSKGVGANGENISLTAAEYEEYQSILQQLIDISPGIVLSYDDQGQAILKYKDALSGAITEQEKYIKNQRDIYIGSGQELFDGLHMQAVELNQKLTQAGNDLSKALGIGHASALKEALDAIGGNSKFGLTAENLKKIYENSDAFLTTLRNSGQYSAESIRDIQMAIKGLSDEYMGLQDVDSKATDWLMEFLKDESWYNNVPTEALDELRSGIDSVTSGLAPFSENMSNATAYGEEFATAIGSEAAQSLRKLAEGLTDGDGDVEAELKAYNDAVKQFAESFEGSPEVLAQLMAYFYSFTNAAKGGAPAVDGATKSVVGLKDALEQLKTGYELLNKARAEMDENGGLSGDTVKSIQEALGEGEKLTDYLYTENGAIKLNTEAWEKRSKAIMENDILALEERIKTLEGENAELWSSSDNGTVTENTDKIRENTAAIADAKAQLELYKSLLESGTAGDDPFDLEGMFSDMDNVSSKAATLVKALEDLGAGNLQNWTDLISKFPELMSMEGLFDIDTLEGQEAAISSVLEKLEADYDGLIQKQIDILQEAKNTEAAAGADDATLAKYDDLIANLEKLKAMNLGEILGTTTNVDPLKELNDSLNAFSTAVSNAQSAQSVLDDIAKGEKTDIELLSEIVDLAKKSERPLTDFISGFNGSGIEFNTDEITAQIDKFLEEVQKLEDSNPGKYGGLTEYVKQMIGDGDVEDPLSNLEDAMSRAEKIINLIKDVTDNGVTLSTISTLQDLFGEDWGKYLVSDSVGNYVDITRNALMGVVDSEMEAQGATAGLQAIFHQLFADAVAGSEEAKNGIDMLTDSLSSMKDAMGLVNDIQSGKGDPLSMLEKALDIAKNVKGINITDLIKFDGNGRFDFSKSGDAIQKYIDSLFDTEEISKQLKELFPDMSEVDISSFVSSFKAAAQAEIEATNETENLQNALSNLSTAISNASSAGSLLQDIAGGEKNDLEIFQEIIQLAEAAGVGVETFISSFDGSKVQWNTDAISNIRDEFLETVQAFEDEHPEASGLTEYFKQLTESAESADAFGDAMGKVKNALDLVRDAVNNGISLDTITKMKELLGEDWESGFVTDDKTGEYIGVNIERINEFIQAQVQAGEMSVAVGAMIQQEWENATKGIDDATSKLDEFTSAMSQLQSTSDLMDSINAGTASFTDMISGIVDIAKSGKIDLSELLTFSGDTITPNIEKIQEYHDSILSFESLKGVIPGITEEGAEALKNYVEQANEAAKATDKFNNAISATSKVKGFVEDAKSGNADFANMLQTASELAQASGREITDFFDIVNGEVKYNSEAAVEWLYSLIDGLVGVNGITPEIAKAWKKSAAAALEAEAAYSAASTGMSNVISAIKSSVSELGLNNEQISQLTNRYQNLSNYDPSRLFEKTGHGIHLNTKALMEYENAFEAQEKAAMQSKLEGLVKKYKDLTDQINNTSNATERAKLFADRSDIAAQIEALTTLQSQYDALTSKYNKWQQAQSMGEEGDMYDNITGGLENINKLYKEGLIGTNKFKSALEMMTGMDTTGMSSADLIKAYEEAYPKMKRYFTEGMQGAKNFVNDLEKIGMATKNAEGGWDFAVDVEKAAEELGVSTDVIEAALRKLKDYNFDIDLSGYGSGIEAYATDIDTALSEIKKSKEELDKAFENGEINVQEYVDAMKVLDDYQKKLEEIQKGKTDTEMPEPVTLDEAIEQINTLQTAIDTMTQAGIEVPVTITGDKELLEKLVGSGDLDNKEAEVEYNANTDDVDNYDPEDKDASVDYNANTEDPDGYEPEDKEATADYNVDSEDVDNYTPEDKQAEVKLKTTSDNSGDSTPSTKTMEVKLTVDSSEVDGYTPPADKTAEVTFTTNSEAPDGYTPEDKNATVVYDTDTSAPDDYTPDDKEATVVYDVDDDAVKSYTPPDKSATVKYKPDFDACKNATPPTLKGKVKYSADMSGVNKAEGTVNGNGTAHARGTAFDRGRYALKNDVIALSGEVGPELVVRDGRFFTVGNDGAEFFRFKSGDIIFNASQTEELLRTGVVRSNNGRGLVIGDGSAYASGTAFVTATGYGAFPQTGGTGSGSHSGSGSHHHHSSGDSSGDSSKDKDPEWFDWIEIAIARIEAKIEALARKATSTFKTLTARLKASLKEIKVVQDEIDLQQKAYKRYLKQANSVKLSEDLKKKVRDGTIDITKYDDSTREKIEEYQEWYEKALKAKDKIDELKEDLAELYQDRFEAVEKAYENKVDSITHKITTLENKNDATDYTGGSKNFKGIRKQEKQKLSALNKEAEALQKKLDEAVASGTIKKGSEAWYEMQQAIDKVKEEAQETALAIKKSYKDAFDAVENNYKNKLSTIQHSLNMLNKQIEASTYTGEPKDYAAVRKVEKQNYNMLNREAAALQKKLDEAVASGEIKEGSDVWYEMVGAINQVKEEAEDTAIAIAKSYKDAFDSIEARYSNTLNVFENASKALQNGLNMIEAKGYLGGASMYEQLKYVESQTIATRKNELKELEASLAKAVSSGKIKEGSDAWYEMRNAIDSTKLSIQESETQLVQYDKKIRQLKWDTFDYLQERIASISSEADFLIDLLENSELFDDNGAFTNAGNATLGLHAVNYDVYAEQVRQYTDALKDLDKEIADDPYDTELIKRREELLKLQRDSVLAIEQEKKAVVELVEEGIRIELDALRELIDKYNESVDSAKELYDYQKKVSQQSNTIANLQKQIAAYSGDTSEENRARLQRLRDEFENANEELQEMQYDKYISDQKRLLDDLYDEYEEILNRRLDDVDALMREIIDSSNNNSETIRATIESECGAVGITMTQAMDDIWSTGGKAGAVVTSMTNGVLEQISNVSSQLAGISEEVNKMVAAGEAVGGTVSDISKAAEDQIATMESILAQAKEAITSGDENTSKATTITSGISDQVSDVYNELELIVDAIEEIQAGGTPSDSGIDLGDLELDLSDSLLELDQTLGGLPELDLSDLDLSDLTLDLDLDDLTFDLDLSDLDIDLDYGGFSGGLVSNGFASGGFVAGAQRSAYRNGDDIVTFNTLKSGEAVLTPEQAAQFKKLVNHLPVLQKVMDVNSYARTLTPVSSAGNNIDMGGFNVTFQIDHVQDYNDLVRQMRDDKRFERMIQTMTVDPLVGKSTLAKKRFYN